MLDRLPTFKVVLSKRGRRWDSRVSMAAHNLINMVAITAISGAVLLALSARHFSDDVIRV